MENIGERRRAGFHVDCEYFFGIVVIIVVMVLLVGRVVAVGIYLSRQGQIVVARRWLYHAHHLLRTRLRMLRLLLLQPQQSVRMASRLLRAGDPNDRAPKGTNRQRQEQGQRQSVEPQGGGRGVSVDQRLAACSATPCCCAAAALPTSAVPRKR